MIYIIERGIMEKILKLSQLLLDIANLSNNHDPEVIGLSLDSRTTSQGDLFFALSGTNSDGRKYINDAIVQGAVAVIYDQEGCEGFHLTGVTVPMVPIIHLKEKVGVIAARFCDHPSTKMTMIGVTGTNGKTSTSQYIAAAFEMIQRRCGVIGTLGYGFPNNLIATSHTTPDALTVQRYLADLYQQGANAVAMEVSSHALSQGRVQGIAFDIGIFTNLTRDHLDYHGNMGNYAAAKRQLFEFPGLRYAIINTDDVFGVELAQSLPGSVAVYGYGTQPDVQNIVNIPMVLAQSIHLNSKGISAKITTPWGEGQLRSRLLGRFNVNNLLAVLTALLILEVPLQTALECLAAINTIPGRMQVLGGGKLPLVVVDYAHTPDALQQVLLALREHTHGKLWGVFGCGGDRDRGKRPLMGQIAERYSDQLVITDDNPRTEDPERIVADIVNGLLCPWAVEVEHDRGTAIAHVIDCAQAGDVILVAGKGHETYQIIGSENIPFSDVAVVQSQLKLRQKLKSNDALGE
jgi:UDP-N-acetylmuramoyl-L-alanyl-D-glutamate--2,6-diaminopimelate ligase